MPEICNEKITVVMATSGKVISLLACIVNRRAFFKIIIDYRGCHLKVLQFTLPLKAFCVHVLMNKNVFLNFVEWLKQKQSSYSQFFCSVTYLSTFYPL